MASAHVVEMAAVSFTPPLSSPDAQDIDPMPSMPARETELNTATPPSAIAPSSEEPDSSPTTTATSTEECISESGSDEDEEEKEPEPEPDPDPDADLLAELLPKAKAGDIPGLTAALPLSPSVLTKIAAAVAKARQIDTFGWILAQDSTLLQETIDNPIYNAACSSLSVPIFKVLVDAGLDLNAYQSLHYGDALTCACMSGDLELVKWLLDNGHDPNLGRHCEGRPAVVWAVTHPPTSKTGNEILQLLLKHQVQVENTGAAIAAAERDNLDAVILLLNAGAGLEEKVRWWGTERQSNDEEGTALFRACVKGRAQTVEYLLGRGANKDTEGFDGSNCWEVAEKGRFLDVTRLLDTLGVTVEWPD